MWDMESLGVSCVKFRQLHADVGRGEGVLTVTAVLRSWWASMDSSGDVMASQ